jgi:4-aminobutyrate aminotransferase-like enzyme
VLGKGLLAAVVFADPRTGEPDKETPTVISELAMRKGLLVVHTGRESIKLGPPLTIPEAALREGIEVFRESVEEAFASRSGRAP